MTSAIIIFPHQLFRENLVTPGIRKAYLIEEYLFFRQYSFHKQKIAFHRASMKYYADHLASKGMDVHYIPSTDKRSDIGFLIDFLEKQNVNEIYYIDPTDNWLEKRIVESAKQAEIKLYKHPSPLFINNTPQLEAFFDPGKSDYFQTRFYIQQRKSRKILISEDNKPLGGKWSFDAENRKPYPKGKQPPGVNYPSANKYYEEALAYTNKNFKNNPGRLTAYPLYPTDHARAHKWLIQFLEMRFHDFGTYEDAIVSRDMILHHSMLSPLLNSGLILPGEVLDMALDYAAKNYIPVNSVEGFTRQIIGWREFIRGIYEYRGSDQRTRNFWGFTRKIPESFYTGNTGIEPVDITVRKVLETGYCHHIERLMVLGNFMLLCELDPDEVYRWFMEMFIDAYDWVMVPNVYGMSQFADGGLMASKPYISGSNYLLKMSDYSKGVWQETWDALFWRFMHVHRDFFLNNPRLGMLISTFDKMPSDRQKKHIERAEKYLESLKLH